MSAPVPTNAPASTEKFNVLSIVAFILTFFVSIVGIVLGFVALSQIKRTGERGRGLALAAVIIGFISIVIGVIAVIVTVSSGAIHATTY